MGTPAAGMPEHSPEDPDRPKKKQKLRMSVVCLNCKTRKIKCDRARPACSNCVKANVGHLCQYEAPHWLNRVKKDDIVESPKPVENIDLPVVDPQLEIQRLRSLIESLRSENHQLKILKKDEENNDLIDFYESYDALYIKRSGMVEHKPLSSIALEGNDTYFMILLGYGNLCNTYYRAQHGDIKRKPDNKKERLDGSLIHYIRLLGEFDLPQVKKVMDFFIKQRLPKYFAMSQVFPNMGGDIAFTPQTIKSKVERILPNTGVIKLYLSRFYKFIYPFFPYISEKLFNERIFNNILTSSNDSSPITLIFEDKFDYGLLSILLIIMRITYISLPDEDPFDQDLKILHQNPIGPEYISLSMDLLSLFKILRKTKLTIVQALLYLKVYFSYSPEDSDGAELNQSHVLFGLIVQSAFIIALNRDSSLHPQLSFSKDVRNLWRRVWYGIKDIDRSITTLSGSSPSIQNPYCSNTKIPEIAIEDSLIEHEMVKELQKSQELLEYFAKLTNLVNNVGIKTRIGDVYQVLKQMRIYVDINYSLIDMKSINELSEEERIAISYVNTKKIQYQLQARSLEITILQNISLHYETQSNHERLDSTRTDLLRISLELTNLIYTFLRTEYSDYLDKNHLVLLNIIVQNAFQRTISTYISISIRFHHAVDLYQRGICSNFNIETAQTILTLISIISSGLNTMVCNKMGKIYYQVFKQCYKYKFLLRSLQKEGFKCLRDTLNFLSQRYSGDPGARIRLLRVVHLKTNPEDALKQLDNLNPFISLSDNQLDEVLKFLKAALILNDDEFNSKDLIWEPGFTKKQSSNNVSINGNANNNNNNNRTNGNLNDIISIVNQQQPIFNGNEMSGELDIGTEGFNSNSLISLDQILNQDLFNFESFNDGVNTSLDWLF